MAIKGDLKSLSLATVLQMLSSENKTGVLSIKRGQDTARIYLKDGKIIAASSGSKEARLGQLLLQRGLLTPPTLKKALSRARQERRPLGTVVLELGLVEAETLRQIIREQVREAVLAVFLWEQGEFDYLDQPINLDERLYEELNTMEVLLEAARRMDEWAVIKQAIPSDSMVFEIPEEAKEAARAKYLETGEWEIASLLDGSRSVRDLVQQCGTSEFSVYQALYALVSSNLAKPRPPRVGEAAKEAAAEARPAQVLNIYHDVLITICRHLEDQLGRDYRQKLIHSCKGSLAPPLRGLVAEYEVERSGYDNIEAVQAAMSAHPETGLKEAAAAFNGLVACLLQNEYEVLGRKQTLHTVSRVNQLLEGLERYQQEQTKTEIIRGIRALLARLVKEM